MIGALAPRSIPSPPLEWSVLHLGPVTIHTYALCIVAGIVLATLWTNHRLTKRGGEPWVVIDIILWAIPLGLLGARLYHVVTHPGDFFYQGADPMRIFYIWEGGNAIIGALLGGAVGAWIGCRLAKIRLLSFADALAPAMLLAQAVGRLGNWFNHELYGWPTDLPWGLEIERSNPAYPSGLPAGVLFHPTFLYEMIWNLIGIGIILLAERMFRMRWGRAFALYLIWYGLGRIWIESIRLDYSEIVLGLRSNVLGALVLVLVGAALLWWQSRRHPEPETSILLEDAEPAARAAADADAHDRELDAAKADADAAERPDAPEDSEPVTAGATSRNASETSR
ncbi:Prolipoprotein diacylglyceryl transferase [Pseudoclavibacter triregionum]|nr:Prolipoprotein diacylglyceryl transferase [Pseudoclavibacter triregionum]